MASKAIPRVSISILAAATLVVATVGAGTAQSPSTGPAGPLPTSADGSLERVQQNGLYVGFAGENPWSFIAPDGTFQGAEAEMVLACAPKLGITEVYPVGLVFDGLLPALQARRIDMTAAGQSIREARLQVAISTQLLYRYGTRIVGMKGDPVLQTLNSWTKAGEAGVEIAGIRGSTELTDTAQFRRQVRSRSDNPSELADLLAGRIKYMAWNDNYFSLYIKENGRAYRGRQGLGLTKACVVPGTTSTPRTSVSATPSMNATRS